MFLALLLTGLGELPLTALVSGTNDVEFSTGSGVSGMYVHALLVEPDDKVVIVGNFSSVAGVKRIHVARLLANGALDSAFNPGNGLNSEVLAVARQPDGKILIGGNFTSVNGVARPRLARLNPDGTVDTSFDAGTGPNNEVRAIAVQPDGRILAAGFFTSVNRTNNKCVVRLMADGKLDPGFHVGAGPSTTYLFSLALQPDGKILVAGEFTSFGGKTRGSVTRLERDGSQDPSFTGKGVDGWLGCVRLQPDGKIILAGDFNVCCGVSRSRIARIHADGSLDTSFNPGRGVAGGSFALVHSVVLDRDGSILMGGLFTTVNGTNRNYLARLLPDGSLDTSFAPKVSNPVRHLALTSLGRLVIGGEFSSVDSLTANRVARLGLPRDSNALPEGFSATWNDGTGFYTTFRNPADAPVVLQSSNNLLEWEDYGTVAARHAVRICDGTASHTRNRFFRSIQP